MNRNINWRSCNNIHQAGREPRFHTSQLWMSQLEDDIRTHGVEIIEINSTDSQSSTEDNRNSKKFSYARKNVKQTEVNRQEQRSIDSKNHWSYANTFNTGGSDENQLELQNRNGLSENGGLHNDLDDSYRFSCETPDTAKIETFHKTCLNILDKLSALDFSSSSDSSPEDFGSNEARDGEMEARWNAEDQEELFYTDINGDKRPVWIYSFKNRRMLSEDTYELVNIPSRETTSSNSSEIDKELNTSKSIRVSSPIPTPHVPRLDLSLGATLPNVTEVTEPIKSLENLHQKHMSITQKPANSWCVDNSEKTTKSKVTDIVNWMALSPRERLTRLNTSIPLETVVEDPQDEDEIHDGNADIKDQSIIEVKSNKVYKADETNVKVSQDSQRSLTSSKRKYINNATYLISPVVHRENINAFMENEAVSPINTVRGAFGDHKVESGITVAQPLLPPTTPIENFEVYHRKGYQDRKVKSAGDASVVRNMPFLDYVEWTPYSIQHGPEVETNKSFIQRCVSCLKCCK